MGILQEFKEFAMRGSVMDMAVGIIIGAAFTTIVNSAVKDLLMPPLGYVTGGLDFNDKKVVLAPAQFGGADGKTILVPANELRWGTFLTVTINFLLVAIAIFLLIKMINRMKRAPLPAPAIPPPPTRTELLLEEIRDSLRANRH